MYNTNLLYWAIKKRISILALLLVLASYLRLYFGVDFTDESGYIGIPYSFSLGARPFYDEITTTQNAGILFYPFVKIYTMLIPHADGLVLYIRHLYFILSIYAASKVFRFSRLHLTYSQSILVSLLPVVFTFCSRPTLCYNTFGLFGLLIGSISFLEVLGAEPKKPILSALTGTLFFALATYAYPTFLLVSFPAVLFCLLRLQAKFKKNKRWKIILCILLTAFVSISFALVSLYCGGMANISKSIAYYRMFGSNFGGLPKFNWILSSLVATKVYGEVVLAGSFAVWIMKTKIRIRWFVLLIVVAALLMGAWYNDEPLSAALFLVTYFGLLPFLFFYSSRNFDSLIDLRFYWLLSVFGGLVFAWTSGTGLASAPLGLLTASTLNVFAAVLITQEKSRDKLSEFIFEGLFFGFMFFMLVCNFRYIHQDGPFLALNSRVMSGAFAGLYTISEKRDLIQNLSADLNSRKPRVESVIFFNDFPAGYLFTDLKRHSQSIWTPTVSPIFMKERTDNVLGYYENGSELPDLAVHIISYSNVKGSLRTESIKSDPVLSFFSKPPYELVTLKPNYAIYERKKKMD